jgi:hypothetical protein
VRRKETMNNNIIWKGMEAAIKRASASALPKAE